MWRKLRATWWFLSLAATEVLFPARTIWVRIQYSFGTVTSKKESDPKSHRDPIDAESQAHFELVWPTTAKFRSKTPKTNLPQEFVGRAEVNSGRPPLENQGKKGLRFIKIAWKARPRKSAQNNGYWVPSWAIIRIVSQVSRAQSQGRLSSEAVESTRVSKSAVSLLSQ